MQVVVSSGTFDGVTVKASPPSGNGNTEGAEEVLSEGLFDPLRSFQQQPRAGARDEFMAGTPPCIVPASTDL